MREFLNGHFAGIAPDALAVDLVGNDHAQRLPVASIGAGIAMREEFDERAETVLARLLLHVESAQERVLRIQLVFRMQNDVQKRLFLRGAEQLRRI